MPKKSDHCGRLEVRASAIHGRGVFAAQDIPEATWIGHYRGRRCSADQDQDASAAERVYRFGLSDGSYIDGAVGGNAMRYINHSCKPNCAAVEVHDARGVIGVDIHSLVHIAQGQELLLDYRLEVAESDHASYACRCGAANCRGTMVAPA